MKPVSSNEVYRSPVFRVTEDEAVDGTGFRIKRSIIRHNGSAVMMAVDEKNRVLLVRQYRLPAGQYMWELPPGRSTTARMRRRRRTRTDRRDGSKGEELEEAGVVLPSPGFVQEKMTVFLATELSQGEAQPMEDERIEVKWFTKKELKEAIRENEIIDAKTMIGYLYWAKL